MQNKDPYENFCIHPFVKMFISTQGQMRACCYAQQPISNDISIVGNSIEKIWNGSTFQNLRKSFNNRTLPKDICRICIESEQKGIRSHRQYENDRWKSLTEFYYKNPHTDAPAPISFNLRMSNECNLQCVMCRPQLSNQIAKTMSIFNQTNKNNLYSHEWDVEKYSTCESNFNDDFSNFIIKNIDTTQEIYAVGGEPFVMKGFQSLIEKIVTMHKSSHIDLHIISNGTVIKESWTEKYLTQFKKVSIGISLDATDKILEYVRYPSKWSVLQDKIIRLKEISNKYPNIIINLEPTIQLLNLKGLESLIEFITNNKLKFDPTFLDTPAPLHFAISPQPYRQQIVEKIKPQVKKLVDLELTDDTSWLDWIYNEPQKKMNDQQYQYFKDMITYFDATRSLKFLSLYPEFEALL